MCIWGGGLFVEGIHWVHSHGAKKRLDVWEEQEIKTESERSNGVLNAKKAGVEKHSRRQKRMKTIKVIRTDSCSHGGGGGPRTGGPPGDTGSPGHFIGSPGSANPRLFSLLPIHPVSASHLQFVTGTMF